MAFGQKHDTDVRTVRLDRRTFRLIVSITRGYYVDLTARYPFAERNTADPCDIFGTLARENDLLSMGIGHELSVV